MKFRRTVSSVIVSALLVVTVLLAVLFFHASTYGLKKVKQAVSYVLSQGNAGLGITMESVDSTLMKGIRINGVRVMTDDGFEAVKIDHVDISLSILRLVGAAMGLNSPRADILVSDASVHINDSTIEKIRAMVSTASQNTDKSSDTPFSKTAIHARVSDLSFDISFNGINAKTAGINATMDMDKGYVVKDAAFNIPFISARVFESEEIVVNDIRASMGEDLTAYLSIADGHYGDILTLDAGSAIATISGSKISAALYVEDAQINGTDMELDASVSGLTVNADYDTSSSDATLKIDIRKTGGSAAGLGADFLVNNLVVSGSYDGKEGALATLLTDDIKLSMSGKTLSSRGISGDFSLNTANLSSLGQLSLKNTVLSGLQDDGINSLDVSSMVLDYSYSSSGLGLRVRSSVLGNIESPFVRDFSFTVDANANLASDLSIQSADFQVSDIKMASLGNSAGLSLKLNEDGNLRGEFRSSNEISAFFGYYGGQLQLNMFLSNLLPYTYKGLYDAVLAETGLVSEKTAVNGNVIISANLDQGFSDYFATLLRGKPQSLPQDADILKAVKNGRVSINTAVRELNVGESPISGAFTFESTLDSGTATIETLAVTAEGLRLSYEGTLELAELIPDGRLLLQNASDGSELAQMVFSHTRGMRTYEFNLTSPLVEDAGLWGNVNWQDLNSIEADVKIKAPVLGQDPVSVKANASVSPARISFEGDLLSLNLGKEENLIKLGGVIKHLQIYPTDSLSLDLESFIDASFDTSTSVYRVGLKHFDVHLSNGLGVGFDLDFSNNKIIISQASLKIDSVVHRLDGSLNFTFKDIPSLLKLQTKDLEGIMDFTSPTGLSRLHASVTDNQFYFDMKYNDDKTGGVEVSLSALGQRDNAFYAKGDIRWGTNSFDLNLIYDDLAVTMYDSKGNLGNLQVNDINFVADFKQMILDGSFGVKNEKLFKSGDLVTQSAKFTINTKVESLAESILQIVSGGDYSVDFTMGITDVHLEDGFEIADAKLDVNLSNGKLNLSGNMLHGYIDLTSGYTDIGIEHDFIFGFNAKGYIGSRLDLMVTDIQFPLPILNQFINSPEFGFRNGIVTGDIFICGTPANPSFYGMAYCQSYEMTLFYLPDQVITAKNVAVSLNDHVMSISKTPMAGYSEADGRYFYGDVAVDMTMQRGKFESFNVRVNVNKDTPIDFWYPNVSDFEMDIRGDVTGYIDYGVYSGPNRFVADINVTNALISFRIEDELPQWYYAPASSENPMELDVKITTGHDIEFYYPEKDNSFINFTLAEDKKVELKIEDGKFKMDGEFALKTGQVYYFQNDFIIREGTVDLRERKLAGFESSFPLVLNLTADITDYDADGNKVVISLILQNSTLDNINPRFSSTPMKSENEILAMLGQSVLSSSALDQSLSLSSIASLAATATDALTRVGILESNKSYSISGIVRNSLGLDIFSARSNIISNVLIDALPGDFAGKSNVSMLARYLDGTSIFAGKYLTSDWFFKIRLMLKSENNTNNSNDFGHFLAKDLILDTEVSLDWDTP
ncbi:MAG: hypothetical protein J6W39_03695, partial [Spirochaetales bacterium]|nr:hypothetical protein [Spirochaetales bacterium]